MSDLSPEQHEAVKEIIESHPAEKLSEEREMGLKIMKQHMIAEIQKEVQRLPPLVKSTALMFYARGVDDMQGVFRRIVEKPTEEELTPG